MGEIALSAVSNMLFLFERQRYVENQIG